MTSLFDPTTAGDIALANRIVMAPLTRNRSPGAVPNTLNVTYYEQRATAGLIITEATAITHQGQGYADVPGLYTSEALDGWKKVTSAVHAAGGKIVVQMWHVGRISHTSLQPGEGQPVSASAITAKAKTYLIGGYPLRFDGNDSIARILVGMQLDGLTPDYVETRNDKVAAVTIDDVKRVAGELLQPDALTFLLVGQPEGLPPGN